MASYFFGKGAVWCGEDGRWQTAPGDEADQLVAAKIEELGLDVAREWVRARRIEMVDEAHRLSLWRKRVVSAAAAAICDRRVAAAFPQGTDDLTDMDFFALFSPWASFGFELRAADLEIAKGHFGREVEGEDLTALHQEVEFTAIGYCGL